MPVALSNISNSLFSNPEQDAPEVSGTLEQDEPTIPSNEKPVADFNTHPSPNPNGEIRRRIRASTDEDGLGSNGEDEQPNKDKLEKLTVVKVFLFDWTTSILGVLVPLFAMQLGYDNMGKCPANLYLPYMVNIIGILGFFIVCYAYLNTGSENFASLKETERMVIEVSSWLLVFLWICELGQLYFMDASFDSSAENYCNLRFYILTINMNIFVPLGFMIGFALFYLDADDINRIPLGGHECPSFDSSDSE